MKQPIITNQITALYERLSRDDEVAGDSVSIQTQKQILRDYAQQHGFYNCVDYTDDGFSGGNFNRPAWERMIADIEAGKISAVIVKDMSRVGRNYLQTGYYTEVYFPQNHVRFIAIANNVDSADQQSSEFAPFLNIMNEWYLRDMSRKQKQAYKARGKAGKRYATIPCFGYRKDPENKYKWIVDEEAADVVRMIFSWAAQGIGVVEIARRLSKQQIEKPSYYMSTHGIWKCSDPWINERPYDWNCRTVGDILAKQEYLGHTINARFSVESYKTHRTVRNDPSEWQIIENTHEPIIDQKTFETVQKARNVKRRTDTLGKANPLTGIVFCADCGRRMYNHRCGSKARKKNAVPDPVTGLFPMDFYACSTYSLTKNRSDRTCTQHQIMTKTIRSLIMNTIRTTVQFALFDKERFIQRVREDSLIRDRTQAKELQKKIAKEEKRIAELDRLIMKLYEDYALDRLPYERYRQMTEQYETEQKALKASLAEDQSKVDSYTDDTDRAERFLAVARQYTDFTVLTDDMILAFVDKILVHAPEKIDGQRVQEVEIHLNHIGKIDLPADIIAIGTKEPDKEAELQKKREYHRRYYRTKVKPKKEAQKAAKAE